MPQAFLFWHISWAMRSDTARVRGNRTAKTDFNFWRFMMSTRSRVFRVIEGERDYQDSLKKDRAEFPTDGTRPITHSVGDFCTMMQHYQNELVAAWTRNPGDTEALHTMRKIAAIAVNCMEQHHAPARKFPAAFVPPHLYL